MARRATTLLAVLAAVLAGLVSGAATPAHATSTATLSDPLRTWLGSASSSATFGTIVTFDSRADVAKIDSLGVGAVKLQSLPIAFATLRQAIRASASSPRNEEGTLVGYPRPEPSGTGPSIERWVSRAASSRLRLKV